MIATPQTVQATRLLSTPELLVIASVIVGQMDQKWAECPHMGVFTDHIRGSRTPLVKLHIDAQGTTALERAAWLADVARVVGEPTPAPWSGIASIYHQNWQDTGITVSAAAHVATPTPSRSHTNR
ncbi:hypothetical protein BJF83_18885 [Nocardiopsis sp. CNR-923]|uniref:hypothetical protein n=1 Tax=Nocardiopsis sp. CNR-923 TaxID=1904965 RepID=UPI0009641E9A|nr:hypothetical protein [Nocardiopsis sp. CNR-923]OLT27161.1 hypothetical protein BJF83_18885 [Nocardiopsis sp. CNR-923]